VVWIAVVAVPGAVALPEFDAPVLAMLALRLLVAAAVLGLIVRSYLRRRRRRAELLSESERLARDEERDAAGDGGADDPADGDDG
jgi:flagellar biosynthesis/type III secretory pathway M-ring protein FliF/YscJ